MNRLSTQATATFVIWLSVTSAMALELQGRVVKIADGDTLTILVDGQQEKIRLSDIDTPERKQPFGTRAKQALAGMTFGKTFSVETNARDRYGRIIGRINVDGLDVNAELVRLGYAWVYRRYSNDAQLLYLEKIARTERLGLWADSNPIPPWEWRRGRRPTSDSLTTSQKGVQIEL